MNEIGLIFIIGDGSTTVLNINTNFNYTFWNNNSIKVGELSYLFWENCDVFVERFWGADVTARHGGISWCASGKLTFLENQS